VMISDSSSGLKLETVYAKGAFKRGPVCYGAAVDGFN
jgi:hypothetical protein